MEFKRVIVLETNKKIIENMIVKLDCNKRVDIHAEVAEDACIDIAIISSDFGDTFKSKSFNLEKGLNNILYNIDEIVPSSCIMIVTAN